MTFKTVREFTAAALASILLLTGCIAGSEPEPEWSRYRISYMDTFDTIVQNVGYTHTGEDFDRYSEEMHELLLYYNQLFDRYNSYEGMNNVKTINDNAGIAPVKVDEPLIDLLEQCVEWEEQSQGAVNVCMGSVLEIWHEYRERYIGTENGEQLPGTPTSTAWSLTGRRGQSISLTPRPRWIWARLPRAMPLNRSPGSSMPMDLPPLP